MSGNSWGAKHKLGLEIAAAAAATALTAGAASPALAGLLGGTAAAEGAGAAGLGAAGAAEAGAAGAGMAAVPGAVAGDAFMPAALATDVAGEAAPAAESTGLLGGLKAGARGLYSDALNSAPAQNLGLSQVYPGPPAPDGSMSVGLSQNVMKAGDYASKLGKAQKAYQSAQGLLGGGQPRGGGAAPAQQRQFGQGASPVNFAQMTAQPNMMMQPQGGQQLPPQLAMLPPNDPRVLAYLQQMGGMYG